MDRDVQLSPFGRVNETTDLDQSYDADSEDSDAAAENLTVTTAMLILRVTFPPRAHLRPIHRQRNGPC